MKIDISPEYVTSLTAVSVGPPYFVSFKLAYNLTREDFLALSGELAEWDRIQQELAAAQSKQSQ